MQTISRPLFLHITCLLTDAPDMDTACHRTSAVPSTPANRPWAASAPSATLTSAQHRCYSNRPRHLPEYPVADCATQPSETRQTNRALLPSRWFLQKNVNRCQAQTKWFRPSDIKPNSWLHLPKTKSGYSRHSHSLRLFVFFTSNHPRSNIEGGLQINKVLCTCVLPYHL